MRSFVIAGLALAGIAAGTLVLGGASPVGDAQGAKNGGSRLTCRARQG